MTDLEHQIARTFVEAGVRGWMHAVPVGGSSRREIGLDPDEPVVMASVYKLPLLIAFCRAVDSGMIDPGEPVTVVPTERTVGPTGLSVMRDTVTMSWRDLAYLMIALSDNAAADVLLERIGLARLEETLRELGIEHTRVRGGTADVHRTLIADTSVSDISAAFRVLESNDVAPEVRAYDPAYGSATTARDMTTLLTMIWGDRVASPEQCEFARELLALQVWPHRIRSGFPHVGVRVAGKTGTLAAIRNEVGVVQFEGERPVAVAVFTHAARADSVLPQADAVIGRAARLAVMDLRSGRL